MFLGAGIGVFVFAAFVRLLSRRLSSGTVRAPKAHCKCYDLSPPFADSLDLSHKSSHTAYSIGVFAVVALVFLWSRHWGA
eukprot:COSAG02_NODE_571_length_20173_cov_14.694032_3_plen_80_part_00